MLLGILKESAPGETRVALLPENLKSLLAQGISVTVEAGAGIRAGASDDAYVEAGATVSADRNAILATADLLPLVNAPGAADQARLKPGAIVIGFLKPLDAPAALSAAIARPVTLFSMELVPRISRAQSMDALSSMATVSGYKAVIAAADRLPRLFPMLMTAAGTIPPARVFVIGAGVAGLQAIATARRLGAVVEGYDVRPETAEQVASLGATFVETGVDARGKGGYARELTAAEKAKIDAVVTKHIQQADLIITTAAIPGRPSPKLISKSQVAGMKAGAVIVDLSAEGGGNCEDTQPGETTRIGQVTIVAPINVPSLLGEDASELYAKNVSSLLALMMKDNIITLNWDDEVLAKTVLTHEGKMHSDKSEHEAYPSNKTDKTRTKTTVKAA